MSRLPPAYRYLETMDPPPPNLVRKALELYGTVETPGPKNSPIIMGWAKELERYGHLGKGVYGADAIPWCGLFVGYCVLEAGWSMVENPLWALNWGKFGNEVPRLNGLLGDIATFRRKTATGWAGHVGIIVGEDALHYHLIAGNTSDSVTFQRKAKSEAVAVRRPPYRVAPASVRPWAISSSTAHGYKHKEA